MNIHEYQAKQLLAKFGVAVPDGGVAYTPKEAASVADRLGGTVFVVKSQIHAGGRGAGRFKGNEDGKGGVRLVKTVDGVRANAEEMLGGVLVTKQTGPAGKEVKRLYIEAGCDIARELYLSFLVDRATSMVTVIASTEGGMEIEEVAEATPEKILTVPIDPVTGLRPHHARSIAFGLGLEGKQVGSAVKFLQAMYRVVVDLDASMVEINPLVVTGAGEVLALDAKMNFDDNALYRHPDVAELRDEDEEDPAELEAAKHELNYVKLDGSIGCMVNGAGLAMATMDIIKQFGEEPANFLDLGGTANKDRVIMGFKTIQSDPNVKSILINIFGGIIHCDMIANGIVEAVKELNFKLPLVVRFQGTNASQGRDVINNSSLGLISIDDFTEAAKKVVELAKE